MSVRLEYGTTVTYFTDDEIDNGAVTLNGRRKLNSVYKETSLMLYPGQVLEDPLFVDDPYYETGRRALASLNLDQSPKYEFQLELIVLPYQCKGI